MAISDKRKDGAYSEYPVDFATGERLFLPPRKLTVRPRFSGGKFTSLGEDDKTMTPELKALCAELIEASDGKQEVSGHALELLMSVAAHLILCVYDATDDELAEALTVRTGTSQHDRLSLQWPDKIYRWVLGGDETTEMLAGSVDG
jgi:hypothetical protein